MDKRKHPPYGLFDAALIPQIWTHLDYWRLSYEPLYRYDYTPIAEAIPYLIELDKSINEDAVERFLSEEDYHSGLFISSATELNELVDRLAYFYHIRDEHNQPFLRRFYDPRIFQRFLSTLTPELIEELFADDTVFYYVDEEKAFYHRISLDDNGELLFAQIEPTSFATELACIE